MYISKELFCQIGPFDERLLELGGEDDDYAARCAIAGIDIVQLKIPSISSVSIKKKKREVPNSWGKIMSEQKGGYSSINHEFLLEKKWLTRDLPFEGATYVPNRKPSYWKLRDGMSTTDFFKQQDES